VIESYLIANTVSLAAAQAIKQPGDKWSTMAGAYARRASARKIDSDEPLG
ncbi:MAG: hypothetical protein IH971_07000, partial [Candidatus Marinimicrobia bacterium]|nr:hypothetical protein [Candidatus Neomarinimicrobiota bacterium]